MLDLRTMGERARLAARLLAVAGTERKNFALESIADAIERQAGSILAANAEDVKAARERGMPEPMVDRLMLDRKRITSMADGVRDVAYLDDPTEETVRGWRRPNGLYIREVRVPIGVIGMIYESRPNVTADAAALCLKAGNAAILRGGAAAIHSNKAIAAAITEGLSAAGLPVDSVQLVEDTTHRSVEEMVTLDEYIDVIIPRGGGSLIRAVVESSTVPVIRTGEGNCHIYVDADADLDIAASVVTNAKASRPSVCNAAETLLVHKDIAERALPVIAHSLREAGVEMRCCAASAAILRDRSFACNDATEEDWATEFLDYTIAVRVVDSLSAALAHIAVYSTGHSECIITDSRAAADRFTRSVDSAAVYVNASTRFTDGGQFGFGAEIGISTQKLHARGPMGLRELTTVKYIITGNGQIRE